MRPKGWPGAHPPETRGLRVASSSRGRIPLCSAEVDEAGRSAESPWVASVDVRAGQGSLARSRSDAASPSGGTPTRHPGLSARRTPPVPRDARSGRRSPSFSSAGPACCVVARGPRPCHPGRDSGPPLPGASCGARAPDPWRLQSHCSDENTRVCGSAGDQRQRSLKSVANERASERRHELLGGGMSPAHSRLCCQVVPRRPRSGQPAWRKAAGLQRPGSRDHRLPSESVGSQALPLPPHQRPRRPGVHLCPGGPAR